MQNPVPRRERSRRNIGSRIRLFGIPIALILGAGVVGFGLAWFPELLRERGGLPKQPPEPPPDFRSVERIDHARLQAMAARRQENREQAEAAPAAVEAIDRYLRERESKDAEACERAASDLSALGEPALGTLRERIVSSPDPVQIAALLALAGEITGQAFDLLCDVRGRIPLTDTGVQEAWVVALSKSGGRRAVPVLALALRDFPEGADPTAIGDGLLAVGQPEDAAALRQIAAATEEERKERMLAIAERLDAAGTPPPSLPDDAQELATALRREESQDQRILLIKKLAALGSPEAALALAEYIRTAQRTPALRDAALNAIDALCGMRGEGCREALHTLFDGLGDAWQIEAARLLEGRATAEDRLFLERWAGNPDADPRVRRAFRDLLAGLDG